MARNRLHVIIVSAIAVVFCTAAISFYIPATGKWGSPDETANYIVSKRIADGQSLRIPSPASVIVDGAGPRSFVIGSGFLLPASFLGMPMLYGAIARVTTDGVLPFLTPLFSALALTCFFFLIRRMFSTGIAVLSVMLLAIHPAFWYWSSRSMYHNALLLDLTIMGFTALAGAMARADERSAWRRWSLFALAGLSLGWAVAVRASELTWISASLAIILVRYRRQLSWRNGWYIGAVFFAVPIAVFLGMNAHLFGRPLTFGYSPTQISTGSASAFTQGLLQKGTQFLFPLGIHWDNVFHYAWNYGVKIFWWLSLPTLFGVIAALRSCTRSSMMTTYLWCYGVLSTWLLIVYGSWDIVDTPDPTQVTIGTSYTRYWLPMFAFGVPFAAEWITGVYHRWSHRGGAQKRRALRAGAAIVAALALVYLSTAMVVTNPVEGLAGFRTVTVEYRNLAQRADFLTPKNAVIISGTADKVFYPERQVITDVVTTGQIAQVRILARAMPVFLYVPATERPIDAQQEWTARGFTFGPQRRLVPHHFLYQLFPHDTATPS